MKDEHERREEKSNDSLRKSDDLQPANVLALDTDKYLPELQDFDLTDEQKIELLQTLWSIMKAFVEVGFGVDSIHHFVPALSAIAQENEAGQIASKSKGCAEQFEKAAPVQAARDENS